jgi:hypothetical protein
VKLPIGRGAEKFAERLRLFAGRAPRTNKVLTEIYKLRNAVEHVNDFRDLFAADIAPERESLAFQRLLQAEVLASTV